LRPDNGIALRANLPPHSAGAAYRRTLWPGVTALTLDACALRPGPAFNRLALRAGDCSAGEALRASNRNALWADDSLTAVTLRASLAAVALDGATLRAALAGGPDDAFALWTYWPSDCSALRPSNADAVLALRPWTATQTPKAVAHRLLAGIEHDRPILTPYL